MDLNLPKKVFISNRLKWRKLIPATDHLEVYTTLIVVRFLNTG